MAPYFNGSAYKLAVSDGWAQVGDGCLMLPSTTLGYASRHGWSLRSLVLDQRLHLPITYLSCMEITEFKIPEVKDINLC